MFKTLVIDPPWEVAAGRAIGGYTKNQGVQVFGVQDNRSRKLAYPTLTVEQIAALDVSSIADKDAHLYLWTINKYVPHAYEVARAWGFSPSTMLTWAKNPMGGGLGGDAFGISTEFCLFCRRGQLAAAKRNNTTWFNWKRPYKNGYPQHSAKPDEFFQLVAQTSPGAYAELFARKPRAGWSVWGNEVVNDFELTSTDHKPALGGTL